MADTFRVTGRPQLGARDPSTALAVAARPGNHAAPAPEVDAELAGLVNGLSQLAPSLAGLQAAQEQKQSVMLERQATADAQKVEAPRDALTGEPATLPQALPPALDQTYRSAYNKVLAQRAAVEVKADMLQAYQEQKDLPDFALDSFLKGRREGALRALQDPTQVAVLGQHMTQAEAEIRAHYQSHMLAKHEQDRTATAFQMAEQAFTPDMDPGQIATRHFDWFVPQMKDIQVDPRTSAQMLFGRLKALSDAAGGRPELFDAMDVKDKDGLTILARNPGLLDHVERERAQARMKRDKAIHEATEGDRAKNLMSYQDDLVNNPFAITRERLVADIGPNGLSAVKAAELWHGALVAQGKKKAEQGLMDDAARGMLGFYDPKDQNKALDAMLGPLAKQVWEAAVGNPKALPGLADALLQRQSATGSTVPVDSLTRLMQTSVTTLPNPEGPDQRFMATAELYKAMKGNHQFRSMYFKEDVDVVLGSFTAQVAAGADPKMAYTKAYSLMDPAVREENKKRANSKEMVEKVTKAANKYVEGSTMWGWIGGNGRPTNSHTLGAWASGEVRKLLELNPDLNDDELHSMVERRAAQNWILDTSSQLAVKVPPALSGPTTQAALSAYTEETKAALQAKGEFPADGVIKYVPVNDEGLYDVQVWADGVGKTISKTPVPLQGILDRHRSKTTLTDPEKASVAALGRALREGGEIPAVDPGVIEKAKSAGYFGRAELMELEARQKRTMVERAAQIPDLGLGRPTGDNTSLTKRGSVTLDHHLTARIAEDLAFGPGAGKDHFSLASSLVAMREGIALQAYDDPATGAGKNVGAGYNLKANAATMAADFKRAGIPADRAQDVMDGRAALTPDQAKGLLRVTLERTSSETQKVAEKAAPGLWDRMTPGQRAVMIDVTYQTGPGGAAKYEKAWAALARGDTASFANELRTFYKKGDSMVEDTRARDLRATMLLGPSSWNARVTHK